MLLLTGYKSKKELKENVGQPLKYRETSMFGPEYKSDGVIYAAHRPDITLLPGREFFAEILMKDGRIARVK